MPAALVAPLIELWRGRRVVALTGAGCSTESGIPDYRGGDRPAPRRPPIQYRAFVDHEPSRRRYWARAVLGWPTIAAARPNPGHHALAALEDAGQLAGVITQNVDGLHHAAGSRQVVELHGALARVRCLGCGALGARAELQDRLLAANPSFHRFANLSSSPGGGKMLADGDAELPDDAFDGFTVDGCRRCGGVLKPDVVFFGENVPRPVIDAAWTLFDRAELLVVIGSSLTVFSGFRFVLRAVERGVPVAIVNRGPTRGDPHAALRVDGPIGALLPALRTGLT